MPREFWPTGLRMPRHMPYDRADLDELMDVINGVGFGRVSKWGKPIITKTAKEEYL